MSRSLVIATLVVVGACGGASPPAMTANGERPIKRRPTFANAGGGPVFVVGAVRDPGPVPWFRGITVMFAIRARGGVDMWTVDPMVEIRRVELGEARRTFTNIIGRSEPEFELAPGDIVFIQDMLTSKERERPDPADEID